LLFTGAEGSIHPSPVPALPDTRFRLVVEEVDDETGAKPDAVGAAERKRARAIEKFIILYWSFDPTWLLFVPGGLLDIILYYIVVFSIFESIKGV
jgi:hypothetical protein